MELIQRRRGLIGSNNKEGLWQSFIIKNPFTLAGNAKTEVNARMAAKHYSQENKAIVSYMLPSISNLQLVWKDWFNVGTADGAFCRYSNSTLQLSTWGSNTYDCVAKTGDEYIVVDPTDILSVYSHQAVANENYSNASAVKRYILSVAPTDGFYIAFRAGYNPTEVAEYDFVCAMIANGSFLQGFRFDGSKHTSGGVTNWDNSSFDCHIYTGDIINFVRIRG